MVPAHEEILIGREYTQEGSLVCIRTKKVTTGGCDSQKIVLRNGGIVFSLHSLVASKEIFTFWLISARPWSRGMTGGENRNGCRDALIARAIPEAPRLLLGSEAT